MSIVLSVNGINYNFPQEGDENWGSDVTNWAQAITLGVLQKSGGLFTLTSEVDFGANFGIKSVYFKSRGSNIASGGILRLANAELVSWRNAGNTADLSIRVNSSNWLQFNSIDLVDLSTSQTISNKSVGSNLLPSVHNSYDLGSNAVRFKDGYFQGNLTVGGTLAAGAVTFTNLTATGNVILGDADTDTLSIGADLISNIIPDVTNTYDLGTSSKKWKDSYFAGSVTSGSFIPTSSVVPSVGVYESSSSVLGLAANSAAVANFSFSSNNATIQLKNTSTGQASIFSGVSTGTLVVGGDTGSNSGSTITLYSSNHASQASDFELKAGSTVVYQYDHSATTHTLAGLSTIQSISSASVANLTIQQSGTGGATLSAQSLNASGESIIRALAGDATNGSKTALFHARNRDSTQSNWWIGTYQTNLFHFRYNSTDDPSLSSLYGSISTAGAWVIGALSSSQTQTINGSTLNLVSSTGLTRSEDALQSVTVVDNSTNNVFSITASGNEHIVVEYSITRSANKETGIILITNDGSTAQHSANSVSIGSVGVVFSSDISAGNVRLRYTSSSTGSNGTMKFVARRWGS